MASQRNRRSWDTRITKYVFYYFLKMENDFHHCGLVFCLTTKTFSIYFCFWLYSLKNTGNFPRKSFSTKKNRKLDRSQGPHLATLIPFLSFVKHYEIKMQTKEDKIEGKSIMHSLLCTFDVMFTPQKIEMIVEIFQIST